MIAESDSARQPEILPGAPTAPDEPQCPDGRCPPVVLSDDPPAGDAVLAAVVVMLDDIAARQVVTLYHLERMADTVSALKNLVAGKDQP